MEAKSILSQELAEQGSIDIPTVAEKIFHEKPELKEEFTEKLEKYNLSEKQVTPQNPSTTKKFEKQYLTTDTGIEIKIPMEEYQNRNSVEFITNADGSISLCFLLLFMYLFFMNPYLRPIPYPICDLPYPIPDPAILRSSVRRLSLPFLPHRSCRSSGYGAGRWK